MAHRTNTAQQRKALSVPTSTLAVAVISAALSVASAPTALFAGLWPALMFVLASVVAAIAAIVQAFRGRGGTAVRVIGVLLALAVLVSGGFVAVLLYVLRDTP